ncbi:MAG: hypothetical protein AAGJ81_13645 [Verrucomicrobiota bacterium]
MIRFSNEYLTEVDIDYDFEYLNRYAAKLAGKYADMRASGGILFNRVNQIEDPQALSIIHGILEHLQLEICGEPYLLLVSTQGLRPHIDARTDPSVDCKLNIPASDLSEACVHYYASGDTPASYGEPQFSYNYRRPTILQTNILHSAGAGANERYNFRAEIRGDYEKVRKHVLEIFED